MDDLGDYILERTRKYKEVEIRIKRVLRKHGESKVEELDWIIDKKFILKDMPIEVFEGEGLSLLSPKAKRAKTYSKTITR